MSTKIFLLLLATFMMPACSRKSYQGTQSDKKEQTEMLVNNKQFVFNARRALPSRGSVVDLTTNPGFIKFSPEFIESSMPFFGRAYSGVEYGGGGLRFSGKPDNFSVEKRGRNFQITATVPAGSDKYTLWLTVMPEGNTSLTISSNNRETITYQGEITSPKNK